MKRNISQITYQIDELAQKGCRLLTKEEKENFFKTTKIKRYYIKGKNKGKERDLYYVDGKCFNQIWKLVYPYVLTSCAKSVYYNSLELEEAIAEVRYFLFYGLQRFGPVFHNKTLSQRLSVTVNMVLTNQSNQSHRKIKTSPFEIENEESFEVFDVEDKSSNLESIDFWCDIPSNLNTSIQSLVSGVPIKEVQKRFNTQKEVTVFAVNYL